jgi:hypothetical protein
LAQFHLAAGLQKSTNQGFKHEARALIMISKKLVIFPNFQLARKYVHIYALIYASGIQALSMNNLS